MALMVCRGCTTACAVGAPACPHCQSTDLVEDYAMPKITVHEGPSIAGTAFSGSWSDEGTPDAWPAQAEREEGEGSSPGTASSTSAETPRSAPEPGSKPDRSPARTTANRSSKARTAKGSTASGTAGARTDDPSPNESASTADGEE